MTIPKDLQSLYKVSVAQLELLPPAPDEGEDPNEGVRFCTNELIERIAQLAKERDGLRDALDVLHRRIETLLGATCPRCENGDKLFVEPETGFYTHCLGGNYCGAHKLHSLLNTEASQKARAALAAESTQGTEG